MCYNGIANLIRSMAMATAGKASRDVQRSRVYAWERKVFDRAIWTATMTLEELESFVKTVWRSERGRMGQAKREHPMVASRRGSSASAFSNAWGRSRMEFGTHCHNRIVALHEISHCLTPRDQSHGPRFVGVLIGLYCRHLDMNANELMALADEMGVNYHIRSIGVVPVFGTARLVEEAVRKEGAMSEMDIACWLNLSYLQVRGAALSLIRKKRARWLRKKLVLL
jgi:hypothetical protein